MEKRRGAGIGTVESAKSLGLRGQLSRRNQRKSNVISSGMEKEKEREKRREREKEREWENSTVFGQ